MSTTVTNPEGAKPEGEPAAMSIEQNRQPKIDGSALPPLETADQGEGTLHTPEYLRGKLDQPAVVPPEGQRHEDYFGDGGDGSDADTLTPTKDRRWGWRKKTGAVVLGAVLAGGTVVGINALTNNSEEPKKENTPEQVTGPDGKPLQYVEFSMQNRDRNHDDTDDGFTDVNENSVYDAYELWDQKNEKFVTPQEAREANGETGFEDATPQDKEDIAKLETAMYLPVGEKTSMPDWRYEYIHLEPIVKRRVMIEFNSRDDYSSDEEWRGAIIAQFDRTPEGISGE